MRRVVTALVAGALLWAPSVALGDPPGPPTTISVRATPSQIHSGGRAHIFGAVAGAPPGSEVRLFTSPYPFPIPNKFTTTTIGPDGSYSFMVMPDRDTRYRVDVPGTPATALTEVQVIGRTITKTKALPLGRERVTVVVFHPRGLRFS
ncbi:MAG TPA: hypothetical protein VMU90_00110, partial [Solirubrobacteraceae bacterium]|nr:hypothetical protein [Solirubrobacteraceae bacterium]